MSESDDIPVNRRVRAAVHNNTTNVYDGNNASRIAPGLLSNVPAFNPKSEDPDGWIETIEEVGQLGDWSDDDKLRVARVKLTAEAKVWYRGEKDYISSWVAFKDAFLDRFTRDRNHYMAAELNTLRMGAGRCKTLAQYSDRFKDLLNRLGYNPRTCTQYTYCYTKGLNKNLRHHMLSFRPDTVQEAVEAAFYIDSMLELQYGHSDDNMAHPNPISRTTYPRHMTTKEGLAPDVRRTQQQRGHAPRYTRNNVGLYHNGYNGPLTHMGNDEDALCALREEVAHMKHVLLAAGIDPETDVDMDYRTSYYESYPTPRRTNVNAPVRHHPQTWDQQSNNIDDNTFIDSEDDYTSGDEDAYSDQEDYYTSDGNGPRMLLNARDCSFSTLRPNPLDTRCLLGNKPGQNVNPIPQHRTCVTPSRYQRANTPDEPKLKKRDLALVTTATHLGSTPGLPSSGATRKDDGVASATCHEVTSLECKRQAPTPTLCLPNEVWRLLVASDIDISHCNLDGKDMQGTYNAHHGGIDTHAAVQVCTFNLDHGTHSDAHIERDTRPNHGTFLSTTESIANECHGRASCATPVGISMPLVGDCNAPKELGMACAERSMALEQWDLPKQSYPHWEFMIKDHPSGDQDPLAGRTHVDTFEAPHAPGDASDPSPIDPMPTTTMAQLLNALRLQRMEIRALADYARSVLERSSQDDVEAEKRKREGLG